MCSYIRCCVPVDGDEDTFLGIDDGELQELLGFPTEETLHEAMRESTAPNMHRGSK